MPSAWAFPTPHGPPDGRPPTEGPLNGHDWPLAQLEPKSLMRLDLELDAVFAGLEPPYPLALPAGAADPICPLPIARFRGG